MKVDRILSPLGQLNDTGGKSFSQKLSVGATDVRGMPRVPVLSGLPEVMRLGFGRGLLLAHGLAL